MLSVSFAQSSRYELTPNITIICNTTPEQKFINLGTDLSSASPSHIVVPGQLTLLPLPSTETSPATPAAFFPPCRNKLIICCLVLCLVLTANSFTPPSSSASATSASSSSLTSAGEESLIASLGVPLRGGGLMISVTSPRAEVTYGGTGRGVSRASATRSKWIVS